MKPSMDSTTITADLAKAVFQSAVALDHELARTARAVWNNEYFYMLDV